MKDMPWFIYLILIILVYLLVGRFIVGLLNDATWLDFESDMSVMVLWPLVILLCIAFVVGRVVVWFVTEILSIPFDFVEKLGRTVQKKLTRMFKKEKSDDRIHDNF